MVQVDLSNIWCAVSLRDLWSCEAELRDAHTHLMDGCNGNFLPWLSDSEQWRRDLAPVEQAAATVREQSEVLLVVGCNSATRGLQALLEMLSPVEKRDVEIRFVGEDISPYTMEKLGRYLENREYSLHIISQSGEELSCSLAVRALRWMMTRRYGSEKTRERIFVTTDRSQGHFRQLATEEGYTSFVLPRSLRNHVSVLTPSVLLALAVVGVDVRKLLNGATQAAQDYDMRDFENPLWLYAAARVMVARAGKSVEALCMSGDNQDALGRWWRDLVATRSESLVPVVYQWPRDLPFHYNQLTGTAPIQGTLLRFTQIEPKMRVEMDWKDVDGLHDLEDYTLTEIRELGVDTALEAVNLSDTPFVMVECGEKTGENIGNLMYMLELSSILSGRMLGKEPYGPGKNPTFHESFTQVLQK